MGSRKIMNTAFRLSKAYFFISYFIVNISSHNKLFIAKFFLGGCSYLNHHTVVLASSADITWTSKEFTTSFSLRFRGFEEVFVRCSHFWRRKLFFVRFCVLISDYGWDKTQGCGTKSWLVSFSSDGRHYIVHVHCSRVRSFILSKKCISALINEFSTIFKIWK